MVLRREGNTVTQHSDGASQWDLIANISPQQKDAARHTVASLAADVDDAVLLMRACGLIKDPLANRYLILQSGKRKVIRRAQPEQI